MTAQDDSSPNIVHQLSPSLTSKQRRFLKSLGHDLKPVVMVGQKGVSENLMLNVVDALRSHELIKVKVHEADDLEDVARAIFDATGAQLAQSIGKNLLFFKSNPEHPTIQLPRSSRIS